MEPPINLWSPPGLVSFFPGSHGRSGLPDIGAAVSQSTNTPHCADETRSHLLLPAEGPKAGRGDRLRNPALATKIIMFVANTSEH